MAGARVGQPVVLVVVKYGIILVTDRGKKKNNKDSKLLEIVSPDISGTSTKNKNSSS